MLHFKKHSLLTCGFGEGGDTPIGALPRKPVINSKSSGIKSESGASFSRSDFINWHAESGGPKFNKRAEHGGYSFYSSYEN